MRVDAHVSGSARQTLVFAVWNVLVVLWVDVLLREAKVNDEDRVIFVARMPTEQKVLWFNVSVDEKL